MQTYTIARLSKPNNLIHKLHNGQVKRNPKLFSAKWKNNLVFLFVTLFVLVFLINLCGSYKAVMLGEWESSFAVPGKISPNYKGV